MKALSASEIVGVWERGRAQTPGGRAVALLAAGGAPQPAQAFSVGARDALLAELHELSFGPLLEAVVACPACEQLAEVELALADLPGSEASLAEGSFELELDGVRARFRLPTAADLASLAGPQAEAEMELLERCLAAPAAQLSSELREAVAARMALEEPAAWVEIAVACPDCEHEWSAELDIVAFLWAEVEARARCLLHEVHLLASAYGWREGEILALSPARRQLYLEAVAG